MSTYYFACVDDKICKYWLENKEKMHFKSTLSTCTHFAMSVHSFCSPFSASYSLLKVISLHANTCTRSM